MHKHVAAPFLAMRREALRAGIDLRPVSAFRDFRRQLSIWNAKFAAEKPVYDAAGTVLDVLRLSSAERVEAILRWSAIPGASRHHWGSDFDLIDANAIAPGYSVQLCAAEFSADGPFGRLSDWLDMHAARFGFFCPYRGVLSGVQAEPWHYSFAPVAEPARRSLQPSVLQEALSEASMLGKDAVLDRLADWHARYVMAIDWP